MHYNTQYFKSHPFTFFYYPAYIIHMAQTEFNDCPRCKKEKMKPTGKASVSNDPESGKETGWQRDYKCDSCGYPDDGVAKVAGVNE